MNKPVVLDKDRTCLACKAHTQCRVQRSILKTDWNILFENKREQPNFLTIYVALATACTAFEPYPSDAPPTNPDCTLTTLSFVVQKTILASVDEYPQDAGEQATACVATLAQLGYKVLEERRP